jgi:hypothetical protein
LAGDTFQWLAEEKKHHGDLKTASSPAKAPDRPSFSQRLFKVHLEGKMQKDARLKRLAHRIMRRL